ncbi:immunoglobulin-like domain-containing protein [Listeria rustica]|uniref:DUF5011 domain-containing protein n=1 Tax=Listeria rustica TaxID=2713503 RepID=A0A7W1YEP9_9LIST|nr:immunoglobulin-like domain-containing protein [Listeria rustica]MBA3924783.1 DUF5011 domain-containing protein [Listeria rustica]
MRVKKRIKKGISILSITTLVAGLIFSTEAFSNIAVKEDRAAAAVNPDVITIVNGDMETPRVPTPAPHWKLFAQSAVPGWETTATDGLIEFQAQGFIGTGAIPPMNAASGTQWAELNANEVAALYQDIPTTPGVKVRWQVYHRGLYGVDKAVVEFGPPSGTMVKQVDLSTNHAAWRLYKGTYTIPAGQTTTRFQFRSVSSSTGDVARGNSLDKVLFSSQSILTVGGTFVAPNIKVGKTVDYNVNVSNSGGMSSENNTIKVKIPTEMSYTPGSLSSADADITDEQYDSTTGTLTITLGPLAKDASAGITVPLTAIAVADEAMPELSATYNDEGFTDSIYTAETSGGSIVIGTNDPPVISGDSVTKLNVESVFNPLSTMQSTDTEDGDITENIIIKSNNVNVNQAGTYSVVYEVTDSDGNKTTFTRSVVVVGGPIFTGASSIEVNPNSVFDPLGDITADDKEDGDVTGDIQILSNNVDTGIPGTYEVIFEVTDSDGNKTSFKREVVVTEAPAITGSSSLELNPNSVFDPLVDIASSDKEDGDLTGVVQVITNNVDTSIPGTYEVTYEVTDSDGNKADFKRTVVVTAAPVITGDATTMLNPNAIFDPMSTLQASDNEDGYLTGDIQIVSNNVDTSKPGTYEVVYEVTDSNGNKTSFTRTVIVLEAPVIMGESITKVNPNSVFDPLSTMQAMDKEDGDVTADIKVTYNDVNTNSPGNYSVMYEVTDSDGNTSTFTRTVIVTEVPVITGESNTEINPNSMFDPLSTIQAMDKEDDDLTASVVVTYNDVNTSVSGNYSVTYEVTDSDGNKATFTRTVVVTESPVILGDSSVEVNPNSVFDPLADITAKDKEDGDVTGDIQVVSNNVNTGIPGTYEVLYEVTDSDGNKSTFIRTVTVTEVPVINGANVVEVNPNSVFDVLADITANDKEDGDITDDIQIISNNLNTSVPGTYEVVYEVTDSDGNKINFTRTVIVTEMPVITGDSIVKANPNSIFNPLDNIMSNDKEDGDITGDIQVISNNVDTSKPGTYRVEYEVTDSDGNKARFERNVIVTEAPIITGDSSIEVNPDSIFNPLLGLTGTDNEDGDLTAAIQVISNNVDTSTPGAYEVNYEVIDLDGNKASFTRTVVVTEKPVITGNSSIEVSPNSVFNPWADINAQDKEDGTITESIQVVNNNVDTSVPGTYEVVYEVTDSDGNTSTFTRTVTVTEAPIITGEVSTEVNPNSVFDPMSTIQATDKEDGDVTLNVVITYNDVDTSEPGTYSVMYEVTDSDGNTDTFTREVIVTEKPAFVGDATISINPDSVFVPLDNISATDKEDGALSGIQVVSNNVDTGVPGNYEVVYEVTDSDGNKTTFTRTVVVTEKPFLTGETKTKVYPNSIFNPMTTMEAMDKEDGDITDDIIVVSNNVDTSLPGLYEVVYQVTDSDGNTVSFTRQIEVPNVPKFIGKAQLKLYPNAPFNPLDSIEASDLEDGTLTADIKVISNDVDTSKPGSYEVVYEVTDSDGNKTRFTRVVVVPNIPIFSGESNVKVYPNAMFDPMDDIVANDLEDGDVTSGIKVISDNVDTSIPGTYEVVYEVTDSDGNTARFTRIIEVQNIPLFSGKRSLRLNPGDNFRPLEGIAAVDVEDGDVTDEIKVVSDDVDVNKSGDYEARYEVTDTDGNEATFTRAITVTEAPVISGAENLTIPLGATFNAMEDISALDKEDGVITSEVNVTSNNVNTRMPGEYKVTYEVTDKDGNMAEATRNVTVEPLVGVTDAGMNNLDDAIVSTKINTDYEMPGTLPSTGDSHSQDTLLWGIILSVASVLILRRRK